MGHGQRQEDGNAGLGFLYYALARILRPSSAVVIGSYRGFSPAILGRAMLDNTEDGTLHFIDPSMADNFWQDPTAVKQHFEKLGTPNVRHFHGTTQEFVQTDTYLDLSDLGLVMIDGMHTAEQARFDYCSFVDKLSDEAVVMFHDSLIVRESKIYGAENGYMHTVKLFVDRLRDTPGLEVFSLSLGGGISLVRGKPTNIDHLQAPFEQP